MEGEQFKGCPVCGAKPEFRVIVDDHVWGGQCSYKWGINHQFSVMSWTSMEHCKELWNQRNGEEV